MFFCSYFPPFQFLIIFIFIDILIKFLAKATCSKNGFPFQLYFNFSRIFTTDSAVAKKCATLEYSRLRSLSKNQRHVARPLQFEVTFDCDQKSTSYGTSVVMICFGHERNATWCLNNDDDDWTKGPKMRSKTKE